MLKVQQAFGVTDYCTGAGSAANAHHQATETHIPMVPMKGKKMLFFARPTALFLCQDFARVLWHAMHLLRIFGNML
jgi:hypothetical protein